MKKQEIKKLTKDEELNRDQANEALQTQQQINNAENFLNTKGLPAPRTSPAEVQDDTGVADLETEDNKVVDRERISAAELPFFQKYTKALDAVKKAGKVNPTIIRNAIREEGRKISKLEVDGGDIEVDDSASGLILRSPDGTRYRVTVANGGTLSVASV